MRRREFITLLGGAAAAWPLAVSAQQPGKIPRIGIIDDAPPWDSFRQGLRDLGYIENQNIAIEYRSAESKVGGSSRLSALAVLTLITISCLVGFSTGSSDSFAPFKCDRCSPLRFDTGQ